MLKAIVLSLLAAALFLFLWIVFTVQHWPYRELMLIAAGILVLFSIVMAVLKKRRK